MKDNFITPQEKRQLRQMDIMIWVVIIAIAIVIIAIAIVTVAAVVAIWSITWN